MWVDLLDTKLPKAALSDTQLAALLRSWATLQPELSNLTEGDVWRALAIERVNGRRLQILQRLHGRANVLRVARERKELLRGQLQ